MVPPPQPAPSPDPSDSEHLEGLLAEALGILETGGRPALEKFLAQHEASAGPVRAALAELEGIDLLQQPVGALPEQFDDFELKEQLGAGGMGVVFLAEQRSLHREVALKVIRPELLLFEGARERFRREIEAVARLEHPAIVPILATGSSNDIPYYAMPRLRGRDGESIVREFDGRDPATLTGSDLRSIIDPNAAESATDMVFGGGYWQAIVRLVRQAALGIAHAHLRGVTHRDLKPSNILFTAAGQAVVLDFGLARAGEDPRLTRTGAVAGSPAYMAPEQVRGEPADERTDIYALAATMHCLLSLQPPFALDSQEQLRSRILEGDRSELDARLQIPTELRIVIDCAMDIDRNLRYPSCSHFADDLQAVLEGRTIRARKLPASVRLKRFVQRHRTISVAAAMAMLFVTLLPLLLFWQQREASAAMREQVRKTSSANLELEQANQELANANQALGQANKQLEDQVARSDRSVTVSINAVSRLLAGTNTRKLRRNVIAQSVIEGMLLDAVDLFGKLEIDEKYADTVLDLKLETLSGLIGVQIALGKNEEILASCDQVLSALEGRQLSPAHLMEQASAWRHQASIKMDTLQHEGVEELWEKAGKTFQDLVAMPDYRDECLQQLAMIESMRGALAMRSDEMGQAETHLRKAISLTSEIASGDDGPAEGHGTNQLNLVRLLKSLKRYEEAMQQVDSMLEGLAGATKKHDAAWPVPRYVRAMGLNERARIFQLQGKDDESIAAAQETLAQLHELQRDYEDAPEIARMLGSAHGNLAILFANRKDWSEAVRLSDLAVANCTAALRANPTERQALRFQAIHQRYLAYCLRHAENWERLAIEGMNYGKLRIPPLWREGAARELLRSARHLPEERANELHETAIQWLVQASQAGRQIHVGHELYDPLRADERFQAINGN